MTSGEEAAWSGPPRRARVTVSVDPGLLDVIDTFVEAHPDLDRSKVFDEALYLWYAVLQDEARAERLSAPDGVLPIVEPIRYRDVPIPADVHLTASF